MLTFLIPTTNLNLVTDPRFGSRFFETIQIKILIHIVPQPRFVTIVSNSHMIHAIEL